MRRKLVIALALLLSIGTIDTNAQSLLKRIKKAVESEAVKQIKKGVNKASKVITQSDDNNNNSSSSQEEVFSENQN